MGIKKRIKNLSKKFFSDEAKRKYLIVQINKFKTNIRNIGKKEANGDSLLEWRTTLTCKVNYSEEYYSGNVHYGIGKAIRDFCEFESPIRACIEHGLYFGNYVNYSELDKSGLSAVLTFGQTRKACIERYSNVPVYEIGPYIAYAKDFISDAEIRIIKEKLGKVLLVFPSHSIQHVELNYNIAELIKKIEQVKEKCKIKTVLICLYYVDVLNGMYEKYEKAGYLVVTNGVQEDFLFLSRLKSLIKISDVTMSNSVGTHVGYCVYYNKPHYIYIQDLKQVSSNIDYQLEVDIEKEKQRIDEKTEIANAFSNISEKVNEEQYHICNKYWGFSKVKSKKEMSDIFYFCEKIYQFDKNSVKSIKKHN